jgi:hypothetical protein
VDKKILSFFKKLWHFVGLGLTLGGGRGIMLGRGCFIGTAAVRKILFREAYDDYNRRKN